jgi:hypothetical protein
MRPQHRPDRWTALAHGGQSAHRHAMNSGLMTDIGKEASVARFGSIHDDTSPKFGTPSGERAVGRRGTGHAGRFHPDPAARCDCNLLSSRAQFIEGANRVFDRQIDAS